jgi:hypothetical protein
MRPADAIKTTVPFHFQTHFQYRKMLIFSLDNLAVVLTTTMTLLAQGGSYTGTAVSSVLSSAGGRSNLVPPHPSSFGPTASSFAVQSTSRNVLDMNTSYGGPVHKGSLNGGIVAGVGVGAGGVSGKEDIYVG